MQRKGQQEIKAYRYNGERVIYEAESRYISYCGADCFSNGQTANNRSCKAAKGLETIFKAYHTGKLFTVQSNGPKEPHLLPSGNDIGHAGIDQIDDAERDNDG